MSSGDIALTDFTDLNAQEKTMVLEWRNDAHVRQWMHTNSLIAKEAHFAFIAMLASDNTNRYFLLKQHGTPIGVIYLNHIDTLRKTAELGLYANPSLKGVGDVLMQQLLKLAFIDYKLNTLYAQVFEENRKAIALYTRFQFKTTGQKRVAERVIYIMERFNENR